MPIQISANEELDVIREVISTILDSALVKRGSQRRVTLADGGVSPEYLSYVRHGVYMPKMQTAREIADRLPLSKEDKDRWLYYVNRYWDLSHQFMRSTHTLSATDIRDAMGKVANHLKDATHGSDMEQTARRYQAATKSGEVLLRSISPEQYPFEFVALSLILHDAYSVVGRHMDALYVIKRGRILTDQLEPVQKYINREQLDRLKNNAARSEVVSLNHIGLYKQAYELSLKVEHTDAFRRDKAILLPHLYRDRLNSLSGIKRAPISEALTLAEDIWRTCEGSGDMFMPLLSMLGTKFLGDVLLKKPNKLNIKRALHLLGRTYDTLDAVPNIGTLHRVMLTRTYAEAWLTSGDAVQGYALMAQSLAIAEQAGLQHQVAQISKVLNTDSARHAVS